MRTSVYAVPDNTPVPYWQRVETYPFGYGSRQVFLRRNMTNDSAKPISDARLAALEELSALDQELELKYGLTGNPMIKAQPCKAAKTDSIGLRNGALIESELSRRLR